MNRQGPEQVSVSVSLSVSESERGRVILSIQEPLKNHGTASHNEDILRAYPTSLTKVYHRTVSVASYIIGCRIQNTRA